MAVTASTNASSCPGATSTPRCAAARTTVGKPPRLAAGAVECELAASDVPKDDPVGTGLDVDLESIPNRGNRSSADTCQTTSIASEYVSRQHQTRVRTRQETADAPIDVTQNEHVPHFLSGAFEAERGVAFVRLNEGSIGNRCKILHQSVADTTLHLCAWRGASGLAFRDGRSRKTIERSPEQHIKRLLEQR